MVRDTTCILNKRTRQIITSAEFFKSYCVGLIALLRLLIQIFLAVNDYDAFVVIAHLLTGEIVDAAVLCLAVSLNGVDAVSRGSFAVDCKVGSGSGETCEVECVRVVSQVLLCSVAGEHD